MHPVGPGDAELVRLFVNAERLAEIVRTGVLGHAGPDGALDLSLDQFVDAATGGALTTYVTYGPDGSPATFAFGGRADPHTLTGGCINAPGVRGGVGFATASLAAMVEREFADPTLERVAVSVYRWNTPSVRMLERLGFVAAPAGTVPVDPNAVDAEQSVVYVLHRAGWPGLAAFTARLHGPSAN
ncbi:GNAT family N-acetyltransferase [Virgisporangium aliadipatigenens]|uniref:GNAT family N-acetyltransferase n=1 Tax=Virgisporangium aliadipatigenens TaxID=741659 RepID=UPI001942A8C9|nr:GNAT family protein [Virgisporangium aliadipatigenens]